MAKSPRSRKPEWSKSNGATNRVLQLLEDSGALLEARVARVCQDFARDNHKKLQVHVRTDSITYGRDTEESPLRQIDQCVRLHKEFVLDERTGVQFLVQIPVESKYRKDVEIVGVAYAPRSYRPRVPLIGFVRGSQLSTVIESAQPFLDLPLSHVVFLEIRGASPEKVYGENLVHNAASALYDFVKFDFSEHQRQENSIQTRIIQDMGLVESFEGYLKEKHYLWWSVMHRWTRENLTDDLVDEFNRRLGKDRVYYGMYAHIPMLCVNGALSHYDAARFRVSDGLLTRVRVPGWPGTLRRQLIRYTTEAPLVATNMGGLRHMLNEGLEWFLRLERALEGADAALVRRWPLEAAFYGEAIDRALRKHPEEELRSDLDVFDWLGYWPNQ